MYMCIYVHNHILYTYVTISYTILYIYIYIHTSSKNIIKINISSIYKIHFLTTFLWKYWQQSCWNSRVLPINCLWLRHSTLQVQQDVSLAVIEQEGFVLKSAWQLVLRKSWTMIGQLNRYYWIQINHEIPAWPIIWWWDDCTNSLMMDNWTDSIVYVILSLINTLGQLTSTNSQKFTMLRRKVTGCATVKLPSGLWDHPGE